MLLLGLAAATSVVGAVLPRSTPPKLAHVIRLELGPNQPAFEPSWCVGRQLARPEGAAPEAFEPLVAVHCDDPRSAWAGALADRVAAEGSTEPFASRLERSLLPPDAFGTERRLLLIAEPIGALCLGTRPGWFGGDADMALVPCDSERLRLWTLQQEPRAARLAAAEPGALNGTATSAPKPQRHLCLGVAGERCVARARSVVVPALEPPALMLRRRRGWRVASASVAVLSGESARALLAARQPGWAARALGSWGASVHAVLAELVLASEEAHAMLCAAQPRAAGPLTDAPGARAPLGLGATLACAALAAPSLSLAWGALLAVVVALAAGAAAATALARSSALAKRRAQARSKQRKEQAAPAAPSQRTTAARASEPAGPTRSPDVEADDSAALRQAGVARRPASQTASGCEPAPATAAGRLAQTWPPAAVQAAAPAEAASPLEPALAAAPAAAATEGSTLPSAAVEAAASAEARPLEPALAVAPAAADFADSTSPPDAAAVASSAPAGAPSLERERARADEAVRAGEVGHAEVGVQAEAPLTIEPVELATASSFQLARARFLVASPAVSAHASSEPHADAASPSHSHAAASSSPSGSSGASAVPPAVKPLTAQRRSPPPHVAVPGGEADATARAPLGARKPCTDARGADPALLGAELLQAFAPRRAETPDQKRKLAARYAAALSVAVAFKRATDAAVETLVAAHAAEVCEDAAGELGEPLRTDGARGPAPLAARPDASTDASTDAALAAAPAADADSSAPLGSASPRARSSPLAGSPGQPSHEPLATEEEEDEEAVAPARSRTPTARLPRHAVQPLAERQAFPQPAHGPRAQPGLMQHSSRAKHEAAEADVAAQPATEASSPAPPRAPAEQPTPTPSASPARLAAERRAAESAEAENAFASSWVDGEQPELLMDLRATSALAEATTPGARARDARSPPATVSPRHGEARGAAAERASPRTPAMRHTATPASPASPTTSEGERSARVDASPRAGAVTPQPLRGSELGASRLSPSHASSAFAAASTFGQRVSLDLAQPSTPPWRPPPSSGARRALDSSPASSASTRSPKLVAAGASLRAQSWTQLHFGSAAVSLGSAEQTAAALAHGGGRVRLSMGSTAPSLSSLASESQLAPSPSQIAQMAPLFAFQLRWADTELDPSEEAPEACSLLEEAEEACARLPQTPPAVRSAARQAADAALEEDMRASSLLSCDPERAVAHEAVAVAAYHYRAGMVANAAADTVTAAGHFAASLLAWPAVATLVSLANMHLKLGAANSALAECVYLSLLERTESTRSSEHESEFELALPSAGSPMPIPSGQRRLLRRKLRDAAERRGMQALPAVHPPKLRRAADASVSWLLAHARAYRRLAACGLSLGAAVGPNKTPRSTLKSVPADDDWISPLALRQAAAAYRGAAGQLSSPLGQRAFDVHGLVQRYEQILRTAASRTTSPPHGEEDDSTAPERAAAATRAWDAAWSRELSEGGPGRTAALALAAAAADKDEEAAAEASAEAAEAAEDEPADAVARAESLAEERARAANTLGDGALALEARAATAEELVTDAAEDLLSRRIDALMLRQGRDQYEHVGQLNDLTERAQADAHTATMAAQQAQATAQIIALALAEAKALHMEANDSFRQRCDEQSSGAQTPVAPAQLSAQWAQEVRAATSGRGSRPLSSLGSSYNCSGPAHDGTLSVPPPVPWGAHYDAGAGLSLPRRRPSVKEKEAEVAALRVTLGLPPQQSAATPTGSTAATRT